MNRTQIELSKITVQDRQRDYNEANVVSLMDSIKALGLIQPIVINQDNRLIAGGHRLEAHRRLGLTHIDVVYKETLSEGDLQELELTENLRRADLTWQERTLAVAKIHALKKRTAALNATPWGQKETGELLNVTQGSVSYAIAVARALQTFPKDSEIWKCDSASDAYSLIMRWEQERAEAILAKRHMANKPAKDDFDFATTFTAPTAAEVSHHITTTEIQQTYDAQLQQIRKEQNGDDYYIEVNEYPHLVRRIAEHYAASGRDPETFEAYWAQKVHDAIHREHIIDLSSHYHHGDSIAYMMSKPEFFDHIITDIPYGIDIEMIDQSNSIANIDTIKAEHTVEGNEALFAQFFPAAYHCLKPNAFLITWCDIMQWQLMFDIATKAGFKVQRWPITWSKTYPCLNQMAQYNFTKSTEVAMVCRKGLITLVEKQPTCVISCGRDELQDLINHPFAKPFTLWERLIKAVSIENQYILDPFAGRGSCLLSGIQLGRNMFGCELNDQHYNAGLENLKSFYLKQNPKYKFQ
jgi:DNA modification methylase